MSSFWRSAGMNYVQFSNICASVVRRSLKPEFKPDAEKRAESFIKGVKWVEGKPDPSTVSTRSTTGSP